MRPSPRSVITAALVALVIGFAGTRLSSSEVAARAVARATAPPLTELAPIRALPRTTMILAMQEASTHLGAGRPWAAWRSLLPYVEDADELGSAVALLAARAAAGWGGWEEVRRLLWGRSWLDRADGGAGWLLLAAAEEEAGRWDSAAAAYRRYLEIGDGRQALLARLRLARALREAGAAAAAAAAFREAAVAAPAVADWLVALELEASVAAGAIAAGLPSLPEEPTGSAAARVRRARAVVGARLAAGDSLRAVEWLQKEIRILHEQGAAQEAAGLTLEQARLLNALRRAGEARELLRALAWEGSLPADVRVRAANLLGEQPEPRSASEELARAAAYEAAGRWGLAARSLRAAFAAGAPRTPAAEHRLGRLLFDAGDFRAARSVLTDVAPQLASPEAIAEAELYAARARFRAGDRAGGLQELQRLADRRPGTAAAGTALFLLADAAPRLEQAVPLYRRAAAVTSSPDAREALYRLGDRSLKLRDTAAAIRAWEEYVARYPSGEETARIAYAVARLHERAGAATRARAMYRAAMDADPLSYHAVRAGERLGTDPLAAILAEPRPWVGLATDPVDARAALERLDLLRRAGLDAEWQEELDAVVRRLDRRPAALLALAEGLRDQGHPVEAIRLGRRLLERRDGEWDVRLLRIVFPLLYRELILQEAERQQIDPMLLAALVRQESTFRPAVRSRVGATGLAQIMPATGRWIAARSGVPADHYTDRLLSVPEVNLRMGALYLGDLLRRYGGARDLALAGYNAGPARADRWRRELGYDRDVDGFRDAIPFDETRHYVRIVLRNAWVYERLYGDAGAGTVPATPAASVAE